MAFKSPLEIAEATCAAGCKKTELPIDKMLVLGFLAGAYIAFGSLLAVMVTPDTVKFLGMGLKKLVFGGVFPIGLMFVVIGGAELFTGNCLVPTIACLTGRAKWGRLLKNWLFVYIGNFIGSLVVAFCLSHLTGFFTTGDWQTSINGIAEAKVAIPFWQAFWRGVGCNWLVCLAVWLATASDDVTGKIWGIWFPIMGFVAIGFEHSIANMFFIPAGIFAGANVTWGQLFLNNLIPATLGNVVGGALFVGGIYWYVYMRGES